MFFPEISYCGDCRIRFKVTKVQIDVKKMTLFFTGYSFLFDKKMEMNTSQLKWRWTTISLISVDNPSQNMLLYFSFETDQNLH